MLVPLCLQRDPFEDELNAEGGWITEADPRDDMPALRNTRHHQRRDKCERCPVSIDRYPGAPSASGL
jgi:hypothetical protein